MLVQKLPMTSWSDPFAVRQSKTILARSCEAGRASGSGCQTWSRVSFELSFSFVRRIIPKSTWAEIRTAYASGIGLREIARNMGLPEGTVLAHAKREGWTRQIDSSKALAKREDAPLAVTPVEAVAITSVVSGPPKEILSAMSAD